MLPEGVYSRHKYIIVSKRQYMFVNAKPLFYPEN